MSFFSYRGSQDFHQACLNELARSLTRVNRDINEKVHQKSYGVVSLLTKLGEGKKLLLILSSPTNRKLFFSPTVQKQRRDLVLIREG